MRSHFLHMLIYATIVSTFFATMFRDAPKGRLRLGGILWLAMVGSIAACRDDRHIRIDVLSHVLPEWAIKLTRVVVDVFAAVVCGVIAWQAWRYLQLEIEFEDVVLLDTPAWIAHAVIPAAFLLISYRFVILAVKKIGELVSGAPDEKRS